MALIPSGGVDEFEERIPDYYSDPSVLEPKLGQIFTEEVDCYQFYNLYDRFNGFGIRRSRKRDLKKKGVKTMQEFCCIREGNDRNAGPNPTRIGCKAMIRINRSSKEHDWVVTAFESSHNHGMKRGFSHTSNYRSHNQIDDGTKNLLVEMVDKGVPRSNMYGLVAGLHGGPSLSPFTRKAVHRLVYAIRKDECSDDIQKAIDFFREQQLHNRNFFYTIQVDKATRVKNIFWAHASSRLGFEHFGDVVTFDTTYRTNKYNMPFGIFVGVNNHYQSVVFGCALLREETVESFKWLFRTFTKAMRGKEPVSILTDNCHQMEVAISEVWPDAKHRVCKWHVLKKAKENLGNIYSRKRSTFKDEFHDAINLPNTPDEFERAWKSVREKYDLKESTYLNRMWDMREKWAPAYFKDFFFAKMSTTQRSESMNHVLKAYVKPSSSINGFAKRYESFFYDRIQVENAEEFHCFNGKVSTTTYSPIESHAASVYTRGAFAKFKEQLMASLSFKVEAAPNENELRVVYNGTNTKKCWGKDAYEVHANIVEGEFSCDCKLFEHLGILCSHILMVLVHYGFKEIPSKYVLKRWTKSARDLIPEHLDGYVQDKEAAESRCYRHALLHKQALDFIRIGDATAETCEMAMEGLAKLMENLKMRCAHSESVLTEGRRSDRGLGKKPVIVEMDDTDGSDDTIGGDEDDVEMSDGSEDADDSILDAEILPPEMRRGRGRPKINRYVSNGESASEEKKRKEKKKKSTDNSSSEEGTKKPQIRYCGKCGLTGHNRATCGRESSYKRKN